MNRFSARSSLSRRRLLVGCLFAVSLSFVAGMTDAIGFLTAGDFVAFMSGNTTRLSIAIAQGQAEGAVRLLSILLAFVGGNAFGVALARLVARRQIVILLAVSLFVSLGILVDRHPRAMVSVAFAMGIINVALEEVAGHPLGVTYVTGALSRLGRGLGHLLLGTANAGWWLQAIPWAGLFGGTLAGAFLQASLGRSAFLVAGGGAALLGVASLAIPPNWRRGFIARRSPSKLVRSGQPIRSSANGKNGGRTAAPIEGEAAGHRTP